MQVTARKLRPPSRAAGENQLLDYKELERTRGFFVHIQRTYPAMTPYLKGLHLTLDFGSQAETQMDGNSD